MRSYSSANIRILSLIFLLSSCKTVLYYTNDPITFADVEKEGDFNVAGGLNVSQYMSGLSCNASYAIANNIFAKGSFTNFGGGSSSGSTTINGVTTYNKESFSGYAFNLGGGYYKMIGSGFVFEPEIGFTRGLNKNEYSNLLHINISHNKFYIQPSIGFLHKNFDAGFGIRICGLAFDKIDSNDPDYIDNSTPRSNFLVEPGISLAGGGKFKVGAQVSYTFSNYSPYGGFWYVLGGAVYDPLSISLFLKYSLR
jgi:hypothetical protein